VTSGRPTRRWMYRAMTRSVPAKKPRGEGARVARDAPGVVCGRRAAVRSEWRQGMTRVTSAGSLAVTVSSTVRGSWPGTSTVAVYSPRGSAPSQL